MNCTGCTAAINKTDKFCSVCGLKQETKSLTKIQNISAPSVATGESLARSINKPKRVWPTVIVVFVIMVIISALISNSNNSQTSTNNQSDTTSSETVEEAPAPPPPWYPSGFNELTSNLAYQALPVDQMNCGYSSAHNCYQIYVVSNDACTAFVEVNFLVNGVIVDRGIDSASMTAGGQAILSFVSFTTAQYEGDKKVQIIDASCY